MVDNQYYDVYNPKESLEESQKRRAKTRRDVSQITSPGAEELKQTLTDMASGAFQGVRAGSVLPQSNETHNENVKRFNTILNRHKIALADSSQFSTAYGDFSDDIDKNLRDGNFWRHQDLMPMIQHQLDYLRDDMVEQKQLSEYNSTIGMNVKQVIPQLLRQAKSMGGFDNLDNTKEGQVLKQRIIDVAHETNSKTNLFQNLEANQTSVHIGQYMDNVNAYDEALEDYLERFVVGGDLSASSFELLSQHPKAYEARILAESQALTNLMLINTPNAQQAYNFKRIGDGIIEYQTLLTEYAEFERNPETNPTIGTTDDSQIDTDAMDVYEQTKTNFHQLIADMDEQKTDEFQERFVSLYKYMLSDEEADGTLHGSLDDEFKKSLNNANTPYFVEGLWDDGILGDFGLDIENLKAEAFGLLLDDTDRDDEMMLDTSHRKYYHDIWSKENPEWIKEGKGYEDYMDEDFIEGRPEDKDLGFDEYSRYDEGESLETDPRPDYIHAKDVSDEGGTWKSWILPASVTAYGIADEQIHKAGNFFRKGVIEGSKYLSTNFKLSGEQITKFFTSKQVSNFYENLDKYDETLKNLKKGSKEYVRTQGNKQRAIGHFSKYLNKTKEFSHLTGEDIKRLVQTRDKFNIFKLRNNMINSYPKMKSLFKGASSFGKSYAPYGISLAVTDALGMDDIKSQLTAAGITTIAIKKSKKFWPQFKKALNSPKAKRFMLNRYGKAMTKKISVAAASGLGVASWITTLVGMGFLVDDAIDLYKWLTTTDLDELE